MDRGSGPINRFFLTPVGRGFLRGLVKFRLVRSTVEGREHLPKTGGYIVAMRHISKADPLFTWGALRGIVHAVAARGLWLVPVLGLVLWLQGHISIIRGNRDSGAKARARMNNTVQRGRIIIIYPEGGILPAHIMGELKRGVVDVAFECQVPVVPGGIEGADVFWPKGWLIPRHWRAKVVQRFGSPLHPCDYIQDKAGRLKMLDDLLHAMAQLSGLPDDFQVMKRSDAWAMSK